MDKESFKKILTELIKSEEIKFEMEHFEWGGWVHYIIIDGEKIKIY